MMLNPSPRIDHEVAEERRQQARLRAIAERAEALALANADAPDVIAQQLAADSELKFWKGLGNGLALSFAFYAVVFAAWWAVS
jgi:hypothetical protein